MNQITAAIRNKNDHPSSSYYLHHRILQNITTAESSVGMECVMDYSNIFETSEQFSRQDLLDWARALGERHGMVLVIKSSEYGSVRRRDMYYINQLPKSIRSYILNVEDVKSDGNCGYRCVALHLGRGEEGFPSVRKELMEELIENKWEYMLLFPDDGYEQMLERLDHPGNSTAPYEKWMDMPDMAHVVACCYKIVVVYLSPNQCLTFHPLRSIPPPLPRRSILYMGYVNGNHFVKLNMVDNCPMPPTAVNCRLHRESCALGWEPPYLTRMAHFKTLVGDSVATREVFEISDDDIL